MNRHILAAIRSTPWAIMPEYLELICALAMRQATGDHRAAVRDGHEDRYPMAIAQMGQRVNGTSTVAFRDGVASIPIFGPILPRANVMQEDSGMISLATVARDFQAVQAMPDVQQILLVFDSPGGMITDVHAFAMMVAQSSKPVSGFATGNCCSAAYWIASQCKELAADPTALIGSLGVCVSGDYQVEPDSEGEMEVTIVSSNAPNKRPDYSTEDGRAIIRAMLDDAEAVFLADVARGRKTNLATVKSDFGRGGTFTGRAAQAAGMIDRVEANGLPDMIARLARGGRAATPRRAAAANSLKAMQACIASL